MANEVEVREQSMLADESIAEGEPDSEIKDEVKEELEREWEEISVILRARNQVSSGTKKAQVKKLCKKDSRNEKIRRQQKPTASI